MTPSEGQINVLLFMYCVFPRLALFNKNLKFLQTLLLIPVLCPPPKKSGSAVNNLDFHTNHNKNGRTTSHEVNGRRFKGSRAGLHLNGVNPKIHHGAPNGIATFHSCLLHQHFCPFGKSVRIFSCWPLPPARGGSASP